MDKRTISTHIYVSSYTIAIGYFMYIYILYNCAFYNVSNYDIHIK